MIINTNENTSIITQEKATIIELVKKIEALYPKFKNQNIWGSRAHLAGSVDFGGVPIWGTLPESCPSVSQKGVHSHCITIWREAGPPRRSPDQGPRPGNPQNPTIEL